MKYDKETINEKIRNKVAPISMLLDIVDTEENRKSEAMSKVLDACRESVKRLCLLGMTSFEPEDSLYFTEPSETDEDDEVAETPLNAARNRREHEKRIERMNDFFSHVWMAFAECFEAEELRELVTINPIFNLIYNEGYRDGISKSPRC